MNIGKHSGLFLFFLFLIFSIHCRAQINLVLIEEFNDNRRQWPVTNNAGDIMKIENGKFDWLHTSATPWSIFKKNANIKPEQDFSLEIKTETLSAGEWSFTWGQRDINNSFNFSIKKNMFRIFSSHDGERTIHQDFVESSHLTLKENILRIEKKDGLILYYINGKKVFEEHYRGVMGEGFGLCLWEPVHLKIDEIIIRQDRKDIRLVPNLQVNDISERLSENVNTINDDMIPVISPDGKTLYYVGRGYPENIGSPKDDIYFSTIDSNGIWSKGKNIGAPLNNSNYNYVCSVLPDGNTLLLANVYNKNGEIGKGVSLTHRLLEGWSFPEPVRIKHYHNYSDASESCLAGNGKVLLTTLNRNDSYGKNDIYASFEKKGIWSEPVNLGKNINTFEDEISPFMAADGITLYFSSRGHAGYGEADIFVAKRLDDTWKNWTKPYNLGPKINSEAFEGYFTLPASGAYAYFVGDHQGNLDIFRIPLPPEIKPDPVVIVGGKVYDANTKLALAAHIEYEELSSGEEMGAASSDPQTGDYKIALPHGKHYGYRAVADGYISQSENLDLLATRDYEEINKNLYLVPIEVGQTIALNNVFFAQSDPNLLPLSFPELNRLYDLMLSNPTMEIELDGHTDNQGSVELNFKLSEERVKKVKDYLVKKGIDASRITGRGFGGTRPIASNTGEQTRRLNRRVELVITKK